MHTDKPTTEQSNRSHNNAFSRTLSRLLFYQSKKNGEAKAFLILLCSNVRASSQRKHSFKNLCRQECYVFAASY